MKNKFNLSHYRLTSMDMGQLVPIMCEPVLPGDLMQHSVDSLIRVAPLATPVMHPVDVKVNSFFVPTRLIWDDFEDWITGGDDGNDASVFPTFTDQGVTEGSLADHLGLPINGSPVSTSSALPFRAYALIWNTYFRDPDLQTELTIDKTSVIVTGKPFIGSPK